MGIGAWCKGKYNIVAVLFPTSSSKLRVHNVRASRVIQDLPLRRLHGHMVVAYEWSLRIKGNKKVVKEVQHRVT